MPSPGNPTLDQLRVLTEVVESGSFSGAARRLNRTQSVVSYTIANLEAQLGLSLFERGHRRPLLTDAGRAVLADARRVGLIVDELRARAAGLTRGLEAEVSVVVDVMFPTCRLLAALDEFSRVFPTVALRLRVEALGAAVQPVLDRTCDLGIGGPIVQFMNSLERRLVGHAQLVPVAAPQHPLAHANAPVAESVLREHTQLVLTDRTNLSEGQDFGVLSIRTWRLGDLGAKHALLLGGLGWGNMPELMVRDDIREGRLVRLQLDSADGPAYPLSLIHRADTPPGQAGRWLADRFAQAHPQTEQSDPQPDAGITPLHIEKAEGLAGSAADVYS